MKKKKIIHLIFAVVAVVSCRGRDYPELRQLFVEAGQMFRDYRLALEKADTAVSAVEVMKIFNPRIEEFIRKKEQIQEKYPELKEIQRLRQTCNQMEEFQTFRNDFSEFYKMGDAIARKFNQDKTFKAESLKGRALILRIF